ncbi:MAG: hypothetical protein IKK40_06585 [Bacteroidales bacterium]|nr:hypothetical protein [Bacteroidales bacterium]
MKTILSKTIEPSEIDFSIDTTVFSIGNIFMQAAMVDSRSKKMDVETLLKRGLTWVSLRIYIKVNRFPHNEEDITVETWVESCSRLATQRNCTMRDAQGNSLVDITSMWSLLDFNTRRPTNILEQLPEFPEKFVLNEPSVIRQPEKVFPPTNPVCVGTHKVLYSDLDCNMHVTSFHYVLWVMDTISLDEYKEKAITETEINFIKECRYGETVLLYREDISENEAVFEIRNAEGEVLNRQRMVFSKRK